MSKADVREIAILALVFAYVGAALAIFPKWTVDDAFITCRYAENLAIHGELNWNPGEPPVEGYTGVALPVLLAGVSRLGGSPVTAGKVIGILSFLLSVLMVHASLRVLGIGRAVRCLAAALLGAAPLMLTHALSGLETTLFMAAISLALFLLLKCLSHDGGGGGFMTLCSPVHS